MNVERFDIIESLNQISERQQKELRNKGIDDWINCCKKNV